MDISRIARKKWRIEHFIARHLQWGIEGKAVFTQVSLKQKIFGGDNTIFKPLLNLHGNKPWTLWWMILNPHGCTSSARHQWRMQSIWVSIFTILPGTCKEAWGLWSRESLSSLWVVPRVVHNHWTGLDWTPSLTFEVQHYDSILMLICSLMWGKIKCLML